MGKKDRRNGKHRRFTKEVPWRRVVQSALKHSSTKRVKGISQTEEMELICRSYLPSENPYSLLGPGALTVRQKHRSQDAPGPLPLLLKGQQPPGQTEGLNLYY